MQVRVRQLTKRFGTTTVLRSVSLEVQDRELFFLLGPSGCGKTTLLRTVAGFYVPDEGELSFGDRRMNDVPPHRRNTGMVFQNYALWPHLTVAENVAYGLEVRSVSAAEKKQRVAEALRIVQMEPFGDRTPNQLSGGQQQRVALARALVIRPDVLLLDEPLSNLDARLRLEMRDEIRRIHDETRITTIYVTHDQKEALSMADRMAVLRDGVVEQIGPPREVYRRPASRFVADFIGEANWLPGTTVGAAPGGVGFDTPVGRWRAEVGPGLGEGGGTGSAGSGTGAGAGNVVQVGFRPEAVVIEKGTGTGTGTGAGTGTGSGIESSGADWNRFEAVVERVTYLGEIEQYVLVLADGTRIKAFEQNPETVRPGGSRVRVRVSPANVFLLPGSAAGGA